LQLKYLHLFRCWALSFGFNKNCLNKCRFCSDLNARSGPKTGQSKSWFFQQATTVCCGKKQKTGQTNSRPQKQTLKIWKAVQLLKPKKVQEITMPVQTAVSKRFIKGNICGPAIKHILRLYGHIYDSKYLPLLRLKLIGLKGQWSDPL
jgi:hypothetical protein